jgi:hypothetical protein
MGTPSALVRVDASRAGDRFDPGPPRNALADALAGYASPDPARGPPPLRLVTLERIGARWTDGVETWDWAPVGAKHRPLLDFLEGVIPVDRS